MIRTCFVWKRSIVPKLVIKLCLCCSGIRSRLWTNTRPLTSDEIFIITPSASPSSSQTRAEMTHSQTNEEDFQEKNVCLKMFQNINFCHLGLFMFQCESTETHPGQTEVKLICTWIISIFLFHRFFTVVNFLFCVFWALTNPAL